MNLQRKLVRRFESEAEIVSLSSRYPPVFGENQAKYEALIKPGRTVSQVLCTWPVDLPWLLPLQLWVRPREGVVQVEGQHWLFQLHGSVEVSSKGLPPGLGTKALELLKEDKREGLTDLRDMGPTIEVTYAKEGRTDSVKSWSMYLFAQSLHSKASDLTQSDHRRLLEDLARGSLLLPWPSHNLRSSYYVLATDPRETEERSQ